MNMIDANDRPSDIDVLDDGAEKMKALLENLGDGGQQNSIENTHNSVAVNVQPLVDNNTNYWDIDDLPTKYRLYADGVKLRARPLKVIEVKKLTAITDDNADSVVNDIIRKCVTGIDYQSIYSADKLYLLLWLRANSFRDNNYVVDFHCSKCSSESTYHFSVDNVIVDYMSKDYDPNEIITFSTGDKASLKLLQIRDEISMSSFKDKYFDLFNESGDEIDSELLSVSFMIDRINGEQHDPLSRYNYVLSMQPGDFSLLTTQLSKYSVGVKPYMNATCDVCGGESQIGISFHPDFFLPKVKS